MRNKNHLDFSLRLQLKVKVIFIMEQRLYEVLNGKEDNYIFPFVWPPEGHSENIPHEIQKVYESGCRAFCIEARPYEGFGEDSWWNDVSIMLEEAKKRDMKVWILDDKHFPTGYANGWIEKKHPELRRHYLREHHVDVMGPQKEMSVLIPPCYEGEKILSVCAWRRSGKGQELCGEPVALSYRNGCDFVYFDVPEGCWRIFVVYDTPIGSPHDHKWYIDMLNPESVRVLIDAVYEEHYKHFSEYFGNTLAGFFSDEPSFGCEHVGEWGYDSVFYYRTVGEPGIAMPWNAEVAELMIKEGVINPITCLPALWYNYENAPNIRYAYMNAITRLWNSNFSYQLGDWCRNHGVQYIGHIIEDMNAHSKIGGSTGHYFRGLSGQDMSGIDIVLQQVMPGMAEYQNAALIAGGVADPEFFHYVLASLGSSLSRIEPRMKGRAMCEVFGAYGWAESAPIMKWLIDFLLVRGINHFVPHAFSCRTDYEDCPPHFYNGGLNPQFEGFSEIMKYANRVAHLFDGTDRQTDGAVVYYAENEWMNNGNSMFCDKPAKALYDAQIDYDILPLDSLKNAVCKDEKLYINGHAHNFLVMPQAANIHDDMRKCIADIEKSGIPVFTFVEKDCEYENLPGETVTAEELLKKIRARKLAHNYGSDKTFLRMGHFKKVNTDYYMLFNEEPSSVEKSVLLPSKGEYLLLNLLTGEYNKAFTADGKADIKLEAGESVILAFGDISFAEFSECKETADIKKLNIRWNISLKSPEKDKEFISYRKDSELLNITGADLLPDFSGYIKYEGEFNADSENAVLNLGYVGQTAHLYINGNDMGIRVTAPYSWDASGQLKKGINKIEIIAANTPANRVKDRFSYLMPIPPSGVLGPVTVTYLKD